jgi:hypothetical protein
VARLFPVRPRGRPEARTTSRSRRVGAAQRNPPARSRPLTFPPSTSSDRSNPSDPSDLPLHTSHFLPSIRTVLPGPRLLAIPPPREKKSGAPATLYAATLYPPTLKPASPIPPRIRPISRTFRCRVYGRPHHETAPPCTLCVRPVRPVPPVRHVVLVLCVLCGYILLAPQRLVLQTPDPLSSDPEPGTPFTPRPSS